MQVNIEIMRAFVRLRKMLASVPLGVLYLEDLGECRDKLAEYLKEYVPLNTLCENHEHKIEK